MNAILFDILIGVLKDPRPPIEDSDFTGSPEITPELREKIEAVVSVISNEKVFALEDPECRPGNETLLQLLEDLLPDPREDEDGHKSLWDIVIELHGRESVKINEKGAAPDWKAWCLIARLFLHFDFLT